MTRIMFAMRNIRQIISWVFALFVAGMAARGLYPYMVAELGAFAGAIAAILLAIAIEVGFSIALREWRSTGRLMTLAWTVMFGMFSMFFTAPPLFSVIQGRQQTERGFLEQRDGAIGEVVSVRDRLTQAAEAARHVATHSSQQAKREEEKGDSCGTASRGKGVRYDFRVADERMFRLLADDLSTRTERLGAVVDRILRVRVETGDALRDGLGRMNADLSQVNSMARDPALTAMADRLEERVRMDTAEHRGRGNEAFTCPDPEIRDRAKRAADQLRMLPAVRGRIEVSDFTDAGTAAAELPARLLTTLVGGFGRPDGLTSAGLTAVGMSVALELILVAFTCLVPIEKSIGQRLEAARRAMDGAPLTDVAAFLRMASTPSTELLALWMLLNRYRVRVGLWDIVVVTHGPNDPRVIELGLVMSYLAGIGWAHRSRLVCQPWLATVAWWRWPEARGPLFREYFRIDMAALDELNLAELLARLRAARASAASTDRLPMIRPIAAE